MRKLFDDYVGYFLALFVIASIGGAAKAMIAKKPWFDVLSSAVVSGFTGFVVGTALMHMMGQEYLMLIFSITGVAGWAGRSLMDRFGAALRGRAEGLLRTDRKDQ